MLCAYQRDPSPFEYYPIPITPHVCLHLTFLSLGYPSRPPGGSVSCQRSRSRRRSSRWSRCLVIDCDGLIGRSIPVVPGSSLLRTSRLIAVGIVVSCFSLPVLTRRGLVRGRTSWVFEVAAPETATWLPG